MTYQIFYKTFMIVWILMNLYSKNLKDLKGLHRFIRFERIIFERIMWIFKNTFKIVSEKNNKKWWDLDKKK